MDFAQTLWVAFAPVVMEAAGIIALLALTWAAAQIKKRTGLEVTEKHRAALHSAIVTGINAALSRNLDGEDAVRTALEHAGKSVPAAIKALRPADGVLENLAASYLQQAYASAGTPK